VSTGAAIPLPSDDTCPDLYSNLVARLDMITNFAQ
jgi:hypothetical protein